MFVPQQWLERRNDALHTNPPDAQEHISVGASDWLWAAFAFISVTLLAALGLHFVVRALFTFFRVQGTGDLLERLFFSLCGE